MNLEERLDKHIQSIKEDAQDIAKVKSLIAKENDKDAKAIQIALLDCCKSGKFKPSVALDNALINYAVNDCIDYKDSEEDEDVLEDALDNLCLSDEWEEGVCVITVGYDFMRDFKKLGISKDFEKTCGNKE